VICSSLRHSGMMARVNEWSHGFICHPHRHSHMEWAIPAFTSQPQSITALWLVLIYRPAEDRRLSWPGWLGKVQTWFAHPKTVTHPSISRGGWESSLRPSSRESSPLTTRLPSNLVGGHCVWMATPLKRPNQFAWLVPEFNNVLSLNASIDSVSWTL